MNEKICWDQSLVKKYSSSNHLKMLNQLRNEVKKYPLNKKKNINSNISNDINYENKKNESSTLAKDISILDKSNHQKEINNNYSTVSFNNSKDFSIYNNKNTDQKKEQVENNLLDIKTSIDQGSSTTFKDRLNEIDLK